MKNYTYKISFVGRKVGAIGKREHLVTEFDSNTVPSLAMDLRNVDGFVSVYDKFEHINYLVLQHATPNKADKFLPAILNCMACGIWGEFKVIKYGKKWHAHTKTIGGQWGARVNRAVKDYPTSAAAQIAYKEA